MDRVDVMVWWLSIIPRATLRVPGSFVDNGRKFHRPYRSTKLSWSHSSLISMEMDHKTRHLSPSPWDISLNIPITIYKWDALSTAHLRHDQQACIYWTQTQTNHQHLIRESDGELTASWVAERPIGWTVKAAAEPMTARRTRARENMVIILKRK